MNGLNIVQRYGFGDYGKFVGGTVDFLSVIRIALAVAVVMTILMIVGMCLIFKKAGIHWWKALIPIYGVIILFDIVYYNKMRFVLLLLPIIGIIIIIKLYVDLAKLFGKGMVYGLFMVFLPFVFLPLLGMVGEYDG